MHEIDNSWANKRILITGVCGTVGSELLRQVLKKKPAEVIGLDNNESATFFLMESYRENPNVHLYLGDIRDRDKLQEKMRGVDIVLHTAALKHVILCEQAPSDAVQTNIIGTQNVISAARANNVKRVLFTSSDKAVNPTNVMGTSKLMCERLMTAANAFRRHNGPIYASTRFGNVLGSRGSVIPLFKKQIAHRGPVTLTHPGMSRFIMTLQEAVQLVMESTFLALGGEVFVTKMPAICISDLAEVMIEMLAPLYGHDPDQIDLKVIGTKPGEKLYEELMNEEEVRRTTELNRYFVVLPAFKAVYDAIDYTYAGQIRDETHRAYNSANVKPMLKNQLRDYLITNKLLDKED